MWPPNDLEVTYELRFEVSDLNNLCSHASVASKCHCSLKFPSPIPPPSPPTVPVPSVDQRAQREALPADKNDIDDVTVRPKWKNSITVVH